MRFCAPATLTPRGLTVAPYLSGTPPVIDTPTNPADLRAYQKNMVEVVRKHPELLELIKQRNQLVERYRAALQERDNREFFGRR